MRSHAVRGERRFAPAAKVRLMAALALSLVMLAGCAQGAVVAGGARDARGALGANAAVAGAAPGAAQAAGAARDRADFMVGADISFLPQEEAGGATYRDTSGAADALTILQRHGVGWVRLRLWHSPADGHSGLAEVLTLARRARAQGMALLLDLHYSDTWADPAHQRVPAAWVGPAARDAVRQRARLHARRGRGAGGAGHAARDGAARQRDHRRAAVGRGTRGRRVRHARAVGAPRASARRGGARRGRGRAGAHVRILLHVDRGGDAAGCRWFFDHLVAQGVRFDAIGISYYPWWHGGLDALTANLRILAERYRRDIVVVETAYPWTLEPLDDTHNLVGLPSQLLPGYPASPQGQAAFLRRLGEIVRATPHGRGRGVFVWAPEWVSAPRFGSGGENLALFDGEGRGLPGLEVLGGAGGLGER